jgi:ISXO2-like transposase domain
MHYLEMQTADIFRKIDTEKKAREWFWQLRFGGKAFECPKCGEEGSFWQHIATPEIRECSVCCVPVRLRASGLLRDSKLPLLTWVSAIAWMMQDKRGVSALSLMRHLQLGSYRTAWLLAHKIRRALQKRDESYQLSGTVELDAASIGSKRAKNQGEVLVAVETRQYVDKKGKSRVKAGFAKMAIGPETTEAAQAFADSALREKTQVNTDGSPALRAIERFDTDYRVMNGDQEQLEAWLPHVFRLLENAKTWIAGTFHGVAVKYLGNYLAEFMYRFNRRHNQNGLFHRTMRACVLSPPVTAQALCA